ncbi:MAG: CAP domain-containing protein [Candidatus Moranbacteria bacterium]|nr:CAP domain-containing protein [Candidatus Moranbacteria bacterium]
MKRIFLPIIIAVILLPMCPVLAAGNDSPWADKAMSLVNKERESRGLPALIPNETLARAATKKLQDMESKKYFAHTSPEGKTPWSFLDDAGYDYRYAGENLAIHFNDPEAEHKAWMESEKHCQNILDPRFREIGMAEKKVFMEGRETILVVQSFGTLRGDETELSSAKDTAVALCRGDMPPTVSGVSEDKGSVGRIALTVANVPTRIRQTVTLWAQSLDERNGMAEILALFSFSLLQVLAVTVSIRLLASREYEEGVFPS